MIDYIKRSIEIHKWLLAQGVTVEPDEFAPILSRWEERRCGIETRETITVTTPHNIGMISYLYPYYGPGGEGNMLKALRALEEHLMGKLWQTTGRACHYAEARAWWFVRGDIAKVIGNGKTDGIALAELLWKIKEASE